MQESWKELFLLHLSVWAVPWDLGTLLDSPSARDRVPQDALTVSELKTILEILCRFRQIAPDPFEISCIKAVTLFTPDTQALHDVQPIEMLQDQAQCVLSEHVRLNYARQPTRFGRLLLLLPSLRSIRRTTIEMLFFKETIGAVPISRLLFDIYEAERSRAETAAIEAAAAAAVAVSTTSASHNGTMLTTTATVAAAVAATEGEK